MNILIHQYYKKTLHILFTFFHYLITSLILIFFFFNDTSTTEIYTLSLHDALPISDLRAWQERHTQQKRDKSCRNFNVNRIPTTLDRKSTRLNSSHRTISYAVFCLKKKKKKKKNK